MRKGENPTKFVRRHPRLAKMDVPNPSRLTFLTISYVPKLIGYYEHGLDVLKLCLSSLYAHTNVEYDLMVFDNGSCREVQDYLVEQKELGNITSLILSSKNFKKLGAWNQLFSSALGEMIYYFDSDIYHKPGWFEGMSEVFDAFPQAGLVCGVPSNSKRYCEKGLAIAQKDRDLTIEEGFFIDEDWIRHWGKSLGGDPELFLQRRLAVPQTRFTRNGVQAYLGATHCQFMVKGSLIKKMFPQSPDWALHKTDKEFDRQVDELGFMRLSTSEAYIDHLGNYLTAEWFEEAKRLGETIKLEDNNSKPKGLFRTLAQKRPIRIPLLWLYAQLYRLIYDA
jgi:glycosyltransferase involved in cell wall biosynthesis